MSGRQTHKLQIIIPTRKNPPIIATLSTDVIDIDNRYEDLKEELEQKADIRRWDQELSVVCDNFANLQSLISPEIKVGLRIDVLFNYCDNEIYNDILIWSQGEINLVSNGTNISKEGGGFHKKRNCLVLWDANVERGELSTESVISCILDF